VEPRLKKTKPVIVPAAVSRDEVTEGAAVLRQGIDYELLYGSFDQLPDFDQLKSSVAATGVVSSLQLGDLAAIRSARSLSVGQAPGFAVR
jgi:hypothetical protein